MHKKTLQAQNRDSKNRGRRSGSKTRDQRFALSFRLTRFLLCSLLRTRPCVTTGFLRHQNASIAHYTMRSTLRASSENLSAPSSLSKPHFKRIQTASITTNVRSTAYYEASLQLSRFLCASTRLSFASGYSCAEITGLKTLSRSRSNTCSNYVMPAQWACAICFSASPRQSQQTVCAKSAIQRVHEPRQKLAQTAQKAEDG